MCHGRDCEHCRQAAREARAHEAFVLDTGIVKKNPLKTPTKKTLWFKFKDDVGVGTGATQADPLDMSFLTIRKSGTSDRSTGE